MSYESIKESIVCGCISGFVANGIVHPIDSYKAQTQFEFSNKLLTRKMIPSLFQGYHLGIHHYNELLERKFD